MTGHPTLQMPEPPRERIEDFSQFYRRTVARINDVLILDRFFPSSIVYGEFFKRDVPLQDITQLSKERNIFTFIIDRETPFRGDEFINEEQWPLIREIYLQKAKANKWEVINNNSTLENCVKEIIAKLQY
jgi:thymidylate kinase